MKVSGNQFQTALLAATESIPHEESHSPRLFAAVERWEPEVYLLKAFSGFFRLHRCQVLFPIVRGGFYPADDFREVEMVNWTALLGLVHGVNVRKTSRHWIGAC